MNWGVTVMPVQLPVRLWRTFGKISELEHEYATPKDYLRQQYFEVFDVVIAELERNFDREVVLIVVETQQLLLSATNEEIWHGTLVY